MLAVFASRHDARARVLVEGWARWDAALLTAADLSRPGWSHDLRWPDHGRAVIDERQIPVADIRGVLTLWPGVFEAELPHILPAERSYVASEMTAFLRSWLMQLPCPVLNRPSAASLAGPSWRREQWVHLAARLGISSRPVHRRVRPGPVDPLTDPPAETVAVTVIGQRCFGDVDPALAADASRLAASAGVPLLTVYFEGRDRGAPLLSADAIPNLAPGDIADAVAAYLLSATDDATALTSP